MHAYYAKYFYTLTRHVPIHVRYLINCKNDMRHHVSTRKIEQTTRSIGLSANRFAKDHFLILQQIVDESILSVANNAGVSFDDRLCVCAAASFSCQ
jgi:hypothetical protein